MYKFIISILIMGLLSGCASRIENFGDYQERVMLCRSMNMTVHVVNGIKNNVPYVREVVCYDKYGATWNASEMSD